MYTVLRATVCGSTIHITGFWQITPEKSEWRPKALLPAIRITRDPKENRSDPNYLLFGDDPLRKRMNRTVEGRPESPPSRSDWF